MSGDKMSENNDNGDQFNTDTRNTDDKCGSIVSGTGKRGGMTCGDDDACDDKRDAAGFVKQEGDELQQEADGLLDPYKQTRGGQFEMTAATTFEDLATTVASWNLSALDMQVIRFRDYDPNAENVPVERTVFQRASRGDSVLYCVKQGMGLWSVYNARAYEQSNGEERLTVRFETDGDCNVTRTICDRGLYINCGFDYDELRKATFLTDDPAQAYPGVYGLYSRSTGWVLPVTDNSVIVYRVDGDGEFNQVDVHWGDDWRDMVRQYPMYLRNDSADEPLIRRNIARYESLLSRLIKEGLDPSQLRDEIDALEK